jgi:hypothetical protein
LSKINASDYQQARGNPQSQPQAVRSSPPVETRRHEPEKLERMLAILPDGLVDLIHLESNAEKLIEAAFGQGP